MIGPFYGIASCTSTLYAHQSENADAPSADRLDLVGDLVALEHVLERADREAELLRDAAEHQDLVLAVAVAVDEALAREDLGERLELEVAARRRRPCGRRPRTRATPRRTRAPRRTGRG